MERSIAVFLALSFLSFFFTALASGFVVRLTPDYRRRRGLVWLGGWALKGLFLPGALWALMNIGVSLRFQPLMPDVQAAKLDGGAWFPEFLRVTADGWFVIASYWAVLTLVWAVWEASTGLEGEARSHFKSLCIACSLGMLIFAIGVVWFAGWPGAGLAGMLIIGPIAGAAPSLLVRRKMTPMYSRAIAKLKFGKYQEAEWEIIRQLERSEDDFDGWMMMAELYANQFKDLAEAEQTILEICDQPRTTQSQLSIALQKLADWHLKLAGDPDAARRALQMICDRTRGTHLAHMAELRLKQLPETPEDLRRQRGADPIPLPPPDTLGDGLGLPGVGDDPERARKLVDECVAQLEQDPNDIEAREKLARLLAERLDKADLALDQITLLLNLPDQSDGKRAEWLGLQAAWNITYRQDAATGRKLLERLIQEFPASPQAFAARRRLQGI